MLLQKLNRTLFGALLISGALGVASQAHAATSLNIDPTYTPRIDVIGTPPQALDADEVEAFILSEWNKTVDLGVAYKQNYEMPMPADSGTAAMYYSTSFSGDPNNATISWDASAMYYIDCGDCYLVVKDGNTNPEAYAYIFDISGWNGQDTINLTNFWNGPGGAISYVGIYNNYSMEDGGGNIAMVPEADTYAMLLAGLGLVGFAARRKLSKTA
jgi:hypothetical protein